MTCSRRSFLVQTGRLAVAGACCGIVPSFLTGCGTPAMIRSSVVDGVVTVDRSRFVQPGFAVVQADGLRAPLFVGWSGEGPVTAVLMLCTHKGCVLEQSGTALSCPCHGSEFSATGLVLKEPADVNLTRYRITTDEQFLHIHVQ